MSQKCNFELCRKCVKGKCTLPQNHMCEYELQMEIIRDLIPGLIHAHQDGNDNFFNVKAQIAATFSRWSGDMETSKRVLKLLKGEK